MGVAQANQGVVDISGTPSFALMDLRLFEACTAIFQEFECKEDMAICISDIERPVPPSPPL
jgi:hypothetical protein